jgi:2,5-diketo-D-gluconate reductase A
MENKAFQIPMVGLGTYAGDNFELLLRSAIDLGYRHIDTAVVYKNEKEIGRFLHSLFFFFLLE